VIGAQERQIGDRVYRVIPLLASRSFLLQPRIMPIVGEVLGALPAIYAPLRTLKPEDGKSPLDMDIGEALASNQATAAARAVADAVAGACAKLPPSELGEIMRTLLDGARAIYADADGRQHADFLFTADRPSIHGHAFDTLMQGRTLETWALLWFAVEVSFPDVFLRARALFGKARAGVPSKA
jgi:hypothetical protein